MYKNARMLKTKKKILKPDKTKIRKTIKILTLFKTLNIIAKIFPFTQQSFS